MCAVFPISTWLGARAGLRRMFMTIFLPWLLFTVLAYFYAASQGPLVAAQANVAVYAFLAAALVFHYIRLRSGLRK